MRGWGRRVEGVSVCVGGGGGGGNISIRRLLKILPRVLKQTWKQKSFIYAEMRQMPPPNPLPPLFTGALQRSFLLTELCEYSKKFR